MVDLKDRSPAEPSLETAVVVQRAYDLALWLIRKTEKFPRQHRYSLGERLVGRSLDVLENLTAAAYAADKRAHLERASEAINSLRLLIRLGNDLGLMGAGAREFCAIQLEEIGRMAGGWRRSLRRV